MKQKKKKEDEKNNEKIEIKKEGDKIDKGD